MWPPPELSVPPAPVFVVAVVAPEVGASEARRFESSLHALTDKETPKRSRLESPTDVLILWCTLFMTFISRVKWIMPSQCSRAAKWTTRRNSFSFDGAKKPQGPRQRGRQAMTSAAPGRTGQGSATRSVPELWARS